MTGHEVAKLAKALGPDHPLVTLANEFAVDMTGRFPSWCCQACGRPCGWLGRLFCGRLYRHHKAGAPEA